MSNNKEEIAIIGVSGRFPGASNIMVPKNWTAKNAK
ncbi:hypothetical protein MPCS_01849 (plasmid) [Candidatus Megaera polyxenophila]|nr:hypothetical protein MPCS_01849 [Candidatus Megaera polyxenophila]